MNEKTHRGGGSRWRQWSNKVLWTILILTSMAMCHSSPVYLKNSHHLSHYQSGRNIRHLPCKIRRSGEEGICMFAIDCLKSNGTHLGTCIDRFYFGSCCHMKDEQLLVEPEISDNSIDENTISHFLHQQTHPTGGTVRPSIEGETPERTERPLIPVSTISATTSHNLSSESSVPALHHHYTTNYDVISLSSSSSSPSSSSPPSTSSAATAQSTSQSTPLEETRFTSSTTPSTTTTPENVKLSTFQSVEEVTKAPVEEVTTTRVITTTHSTRYPTRRTTTQEPTTTSTTTVKSTFSPKPKPKPTHVKRPSSTKKPAVSSTASRPKPTRRPTTPANVTTITKKPTRKPTTATTTLAPILPTRKKTTTGAPRTTTTPKTTTKAPEPTTESTTKVTTTEVRTTTTTQPRTTTKQTTTTTTVNTAGIEEEEKPLTTLSFVETTKAPRPKPKPTSSIVIVPPTTIASEEQVVQNSTQGVESSVTHSEVSQASTSHSADNATREETTTMSSGLVTWTNIDENEKNKTASTTEGWIPLQTIPVESTSETTLGVTESINATTAEVSPADSSTVSSTTGATIGNVTEETSSQTATGDVAQNNTTDTTTPIPSLEGIDYRQICGKRMFPEPRIVGGTKAAFGRWPWQISLRQWRTSTYLHKCGAALLNENWAITAAHCVDNVPPSDLLLRLGEYDLAEEEEPYGYQERRVQIVASHPQFDPRTFEYDLALLRFYEPVIFQPNIIPVCVPESDENFIGRTAYVTGWGRLYEDGPLPSVLQEVTVPVIENSICEAMYRRAGYIEHIPHIFICAGWKNGGFDSCEGDSGGPMVIQRHDKRFQLAGVISWGIGCAEPNQPGVYTRISEFRDWINQILQF